MQSGLQVFFVGMSVYGWLQLDAQRRSRANCPSGLGRLPWHLGAALADHAAVVRQRAAARREHRRSGMAAARLADYLVQPARDLARRARASSRTGSTGSSSTWCWCSSSTCRAADAMALLNVLFIAIAVGGFIAWRRRFQRAGAGGAGMIAGELLQHVPGCEDGDAPYSQELIGGGKVNRSFLVRTRRGRFVVRLNENAASDPGLDRERELALHTAAAERRHRAAGDLRGARPLLPDHRLRRRPAVDAALLHAHARPAFARPAPAVLARGGAAASAALRSDGRRAPLCGRSSCAATRTKAGASSSC